MVVLIGVPLTVYLVLVTWLCVAVGDRTSWRVGWLMAVGGVFLPLALFVAMLLP